MSEGNGKSSEAVLRYAEAKDAPLVFDFVRGLAEYEHLLEQVTATVEGLRRFIFEEKRAEVLICEYGGRAAGFALFFYTFSTFVGKPGIYIEDIFVKPEFRKKGLGKLLLAAVAKIAVERDCGRLEWACLDWNEPSIVFYKSRGARPLSEWTTYRVAGEELKKLASGGFPRPDSP
ncbi:MAG: GNAT family N-acetyltransferase [Spirochaetales bacterium]|jgi:GNAT superfamily N-acetyltransferase|nr:GNAT family N-acetyltransferase [Spirochaetales bacterium]